MTEPTEHGSRVEAAAAGLHHERAEAAVGVPPREHVTAAAAIAHAHPEDPNRGVVRERLSKQSLLAGAVAAGVTVVAFVLLALSIGGHF